ncbi:MAG: TnsA-like heteromeric transposase endonuclease subunit [Microlunatus sp.]|nr:TnsA-like heteromeric transposase endonuclease subunit [Microlunatus sp.]
MSAVQLQYRRRDGGEAVLTSLEDASAAAIVAGSPVRTPPSHRGHRHYPGLFWSSTTKGHVVYESLLELDRLWLADFDPHVVGIATQPLHLSDRDGSTLRRHVPDILLGLSDGGFTLVDVKPSALLDRPEVAAQFAWTARLCHAKGWRYEVFSGGDTTTLRNVRYLAAGRRPGSWAERDVALVRAALGPEDTWRDVEQRAVAAGVPSERVRLVMQSLLWSGQWRIDMSAPLGAGSRITKQVPA